MNKVPPTFSLPRNVNLSDSFPKETIWSYIVNERYKIYTINLLLGLQTLPFLGTLTGTLLFISLKISFTPAVSLLCWSRMLCCIALSSVMKWYSLDLSSHSKGRTRWIGQVVWTLTSWIFLYLIDNNSITRAIGVYVYHFQ